MKGKLEIKRLPLGTTAVSVRCTYIYGTPDVQCNINQKDCKLSQFTPSCYMAFIFPIFHHNQLKSVTKAVITNQLSQKKH